MEGRRVPVVCGRPAVRCLPGASCAPVLTFVGATKQSTRTSTTSPVGPVPYHSRRVPVWFCPPEGRTYFEKYQKTDETVRSRRGPSPRTSSYRSRIGGIHDFRLHPSVGCPRWYLRPGPWGGSFETGGKGGLCRGVLDRWSQI